MANQENIQKINELSQILASIDRSKIIRPELGVESLEKTFTPTLDELYQKVAIIVKVAPFVSNNILQSAIASITSCIQSLGVISNMTNQEFVAGKAAYVTQIEANLETIQTLWPNFYTALQENFPQKDSESQALLEAASLTETIRKNSQEAEENLAQFNRILAEADAIKEATRKTAQYVSIQGAQTQFSKAKDDLYIKIAIASIGAIAALWWFFSLSFEFLNEASTLKDEWTWKIGYHASIRLLILGSIGALSKFFFSLLKAYLHLLEHNLHKVRVANSTEAFVAAAQSPEHRDLILGRLVDSIASFGDSGLLKEGPAEKDSASKINLDFSSKS